MKEVPARPTLLEVDVDAAAHNVRAVRQLVGPERKIFAVIKAGGYGFGAAEMAADWQPEIAIAADIIYPTWLLLECLAEFAKERPETRIEVFETVLEGTQEMLAQHKVDLAIAGREATNAGGTPLMPLRAHAVAAPSHPLHHLGRPATERDLKRHRRVFIRDTAADPRTRVSASRWARCARS